MKAAANCKVTILRGTEANQYNDLVDSDVAVRTGIPASILEQGRRVYLPAEAAFRIIRSYAGRVGAEVDIQKDDRLRDERTGVVYLVTDLADSRSPAHTPDKVLVLSRTN